MKTEIVKDAVVDAVKKGKNTTEDIYNSVKTFYLEKIKDKQCQDFLKLEVGDNFVIKFLWSSLIILWFVIKIRSAVAYKDSTK